MAYSNQLPLKGLFSPCTSLMLASLVYLLIYLEFPEPLLCAGPHAGPSVLPWRSPPFRALHLRDSRQEHGSPRQASKAQQRSKEQLGFYFSFPQHARLSTFS